MKTICPRFGVLLLALAATLAAQSTTQEDFARRQYESGLSFMQNRRYTEALKDFEAVITSFPESSVADNALLQIGLYKLDVVHDITAAQTTIDQLLKKYPDTDSAPMGHVVAGRLALAKGHTPADVDAALASFERVPRLFPGDQAVPAAGFYAGDTLRRVRRNDEALDRFRRVAMEYPQSIWAARATLSAGICLAQSERATRALEEIQRVRQQFPGSPEAGDALNYNSVLYRLYVRPPAQPPYAFSGRYIGSETAKFKDVVGIVIDPAGRILLGHKQGISIFDAKATLAKTVNADQPSAFFVDERGRVVVARRDLLIAEAAESTTVATPTPDGKSRPVEEMVSVIALSNGDRLIADHKGKTVLRLSPAGKYLGTFATLNAERLALNGLDDVAMIDRDSKAIVLVDRDGKSLGKIPAKGTGYELDNPVDLSFDSFGHLYVLDRGRASILVFGPKNKLITTVTVPEKNAGAFQKAQAFAVDAAGRLFIFDDRAQRIQVYQ
jgi:TolA-binding protein